MKQLFLTLLINFYLLNTAYSQSYRLIYDFKWVKYDNNPTQVYEGKTLLHLSHTSSFYMDLNNQDREVLISSNGMRYFSNERPLFKYKIIKDFTKDTLTFSDQVNGQPYYYEMPIPAINWQIKEDTMLVMGYTCQKAIGQFANRTYEAWFATDLPYSNGPDKFGGLPGLIFNISDSDRKINFTAIKIEISTDSTQNIVLEGKKVTKAYFKLIENDYMTNFKKYANSSFQNSKFESNGRTISMDEFFEGVKKDYLSRNNID